MSEFKKCKVIMLPTGDITGIVLHSTGLDKIVHTKESELKAVLDIGGVSQHLYITSDEDIKDGDWYYWKVTNTIQKFKSFPEDKGRAPKNSDGSFKIVATDDKKLKINSIEYLSIELPVSKDKIDFNMGFDNDIPLPQIPQSFIKQYVEAEGKIDEIEIGYYSNIYPITLEIIETVKTDSNNCIIIKPIKESWSREEVEELCRTALHTRFPGNMCMQEDADKWIANYIK